MRLPAEHQDPLRTHERPGRETIGPRLLGAAAFPAIAGGGTVLIYLGIAQGIDSDLIVVAAPAVAAAVIFCLERLIPFERAWTMHGPEVLTDLAHLVVSSGLVPLLYQSSIALGLLRVGEALAHLVGRALWPTGWPLWAQCVLACAIGEFFYYWAHRAGHAVPWLWRFHAIHHSSHRLYWLNVVRFHPVDALLQLVGHVGPLGLLGAPPRVIATVVAATSVHGLLQHSNVDLRLGPLNWIFSAAELHRWHHARDVSRANHNYGQVVLIWDVVFGTRYLPEERPPADVGLAEPAHFPQTYLAQVLSSIRQP
jgi:sterol desaturase/sphingolipid hydroxylase (fatty acid hydroxylase superfamily)